MPVFEVLIVEMPTKKGREDGELETLVLGPEAVVARNQQAAAIIASRRMEKDTNLDRMEVIVRPFV